MCDSNGSNVGGRQGTSDMNISTGNLSTESLTSNGGVLSNQTIDEVSSLFTYSFVFIIIILILLLSFLFLHFHLFSIAFLSMSYIYFLIFPPFFLSCLFYLFVYLLLICF